MPYPDASFDLAISEYGACLWADPHVWVAEAARLLRPGGRLVFLTNGYVLMLCAPEVDEDPPATGCVRDAFGMHRFEWPDDPSVEFHLSHGDWIRLLRENGFEVEDLIELQAPEDATTNDSFVTAEWAQRWPSEEVWVARKRELNRCRRQAGTAGAGSGAPRASPATTYAAMIRMSPHTSPVSVEDATFCIASTAYDRGSTSEITSSVRGSWSRGTNSPHSRICGITSGRHELHRLELGAGEGRDEQPQRRAEHRVDDRDHHQHPGRPDDGQVEHPDAQHRRPAPTARRPPAPKAIA